MAKTAARVKKTQQTNQRLTIPLRIWLLLLLGGAGIMVIEIAGARLLVPNFGNTIYMWASQIAVVLGVMSVGYYVGGRWADKEDRWQKFYRLLAFCGLWLLLLPFIGIIVTLVALPLGVMVGPLIASFLIFAPPVFVMALITPMALAEVCPDKEHVGSSAGALYAYSTVASIAGTLVSGFVLIPAFGVKFIFIGLGLCCLAVALGALNKTDKLTLLILLPVCMIIPFISASSAIVWEGDSAYYHIQIIDYNNTRTLRLDADAHSAQRLNSSEAVFIYTKVMQGAINLRTPTKNILFLGLGSGSMARHALAQPEVESVWAVEIDPVVVDLAKKYFGPLDDERMKIEVGDARQFLQNNNSTYDLMMLDTYSSTQSVPSHLLTEEYFSLLKSRLEPDGLVVFNLISAPKSGLTPHVRAGLAKSFSAVWTYCTANNSREQNLVIMAWNPSANLPDWSPPQQLQGGYVCTMQIESAAQFTDDWAPTDFIMAQSFWPK